MWDLCDVAQAWAEYFAEVLLIGVTLLTAVVAVEQAPVRRAGARWAFLSLALVLPAVLVLVLFSWRFSGAWWTAPPTAVLGQSIRFASLGAFVFGVRALRCHARSADDSARQLQASRQELERQAEEAQ